MRFHSGLTKLSKLWLFDSPTQLIVLLGLNYQVRSQLSRSFDLISAYGVGSAISVVSSPKSGSKQAHRESLAVT